MFYSGHLCITRLWRWTPGTRLYLELQSSELFGSSPVRADARPRSRGKRKPRNTKVLRARPAAIPAGSAGACSLPAGLRWLITLSLEDGMCIYCTYYCLYCVAPPLPSSRRHRIKAFNRIFPGTVGVFTVSFWRISKREKKSEEKEKISPLPSRSRSTSSWSRENGGTGSVGGNDGGIDGRSRTVVITETI